MACWKLSLCVTAVWSIGISGSLAQQWDRQQVQMIDDTAASICNTVGEAKGQKRDVQIEGDVKAEVNGLFKRLATLEGSTKATTIQEQFQGLSRDATATAKENDRECRKHVFDKMFDALKPILGSQPPNPGPGSKPRPQSCSEALNFDQLRDLAASDYLRLKTTVRARGVDFLLCPDEETQLKLSASLHEDQTKFDEIRGIIDQKNCYIPGNPTLRIEGSTTIGGRLMPRIVYGFLHSLHPDVPLQPRILADCGGDRTRFSVDAGGQSYTIDVVATDSAEGYNRLRNWQISIAMSSVKQTAKDNSIRETEIATDQMGIIVNKLNPIRKLTLDQLKGIFAGRITEWTQLEFDIFSRRENQIDDHIIVFSREIGSGTLKEFENIAQLKVDFDNFDNGYLRTVHGQLKMAEEVAETVNGIGYVAAPYVPLNSEVTIIDAETGRVGLRRKLYLYYHDCAGRRIRHLRPEVTAT